MASAATPTTRALEAISYSNPGQNTLRFAKVNTNTTLDQLAHSCSRALKLHQPVVFFDANGRALDGNTPASSLGDRVTYAPSLETVVVKLPNNDNPNFFDKHIQLGIQKNETVGDIRKRVAQLTGLPVESFLFQDDYGLTTYPDEFNITEYFKRSYSGKTLTFFLSTKPIFDNHFSAPPAASEVAEDDWESDFKEPKNSQPTAASEPNLPRFEFSYVKLLSSSYGRANVELPFDGSTSVETLKSRLAEKLNVSFAQIEISGRNSEIDDAALVKDLRGCTLYFTVLNKSDAPKASDAASAADEALSLRYSAAARTEQMFRADGSVLVQTEPDSGDLELGGALEESPDVDSEHFADPAASLM